MVAIKMTNNATLLCKEHMNVNRICDLCESVFEKLDK
jgi:hypothetical protein